MNKSAIIIGGGLGGLFAGAMLSKEGIKVTILEKNKTIGGGLQTFQRFGVTFDTGMHVVCGMQENGNIRRICKYLDIDKEINLTPTNNIADRIYVESDGKTYDIAKGRQGFVSSLSKYFPYEEQNLINYTNALYNITDKIDLYNLRPSEPTHTIPNFSDASNIAADKFIANYLQHSNLRSISAYTNTIYGGIAGKTPAYVHAIISTAYMNGINRFAGGSYKFANLLCKVIKSNGGQVLTSQEVRHITVENKTISHVETNDNIYTADCYISDIHPCTLFTLLDSNALPKAYKSRLSNTQNTYSAFQLYIKLKENTFPYINRSEYYLSHYNNVWKMGEQNHQYPIGFLLMTPPDEQQGKYSNKALVTAPMNFDTVAPWVNTHTGNRGSNYEEWKLATTDKILEKVEQMHPGFRNNIEAINSSSPLTIRDYYSVKDGSMFGLTKDCNNPLQSYIPVATKIQNLLLTGQNINLHGFCGVPLTAITTAEAILGNNYIINKINDKNA